MVVRIDGNKERYDCLTRASPMTTVPPKADHVSVTCLCVMLPSPPNVIICKGVGQGKIARNRCCGHRCKSENA